MTPSARTDDLYRQWRAALRRYIARRVGEPADVDDLLQEVFLRLTAHAAELHHPERMAAWLYRVADRTIADHYRARRPTEGLSDDWPQPVTDAAEGIAALAPCLGPMVAALPETYREAVRLSEIEGVPQAAVAERLGLSLPAVKSRILRGRERLRGLVLECCTVEAGPQGLDCDQRPDGRRFC